MPRKEYTLMRELAGNPIPADSRKGDRHKNKNHRRPGDAPRKNKWQRREIVAWDGEGANLEDGTHVYSLLANSRGKYILDHKGLSTLDCFGFFLAESNPNDINVVYGGSYDINMVLRDVPKDKLEQLWAEGSCYWMGFKIIWAARKKFTVQRIRKGAVAESFVLWDVIGYFQCRFVIACRNWLGDLPILESIDEMKNKRSEFAADQVEEIITYNQRECVLLVQLMQRLFASLDEAELTLNRYDGAGSIAAAILKKYGVKEYMGRITKEVNRYAQYAYSGGRIEAVKVGHIEGSVRIYRYDINSAYPSAAMSLPSFKGSNWVRRASWNGSKYALVYIRFCFSRSAPFYPLWYRDNHGGISYPRAGEGIYWGYEVANLFKYYKEGIDFTVGWSYEPEIVDESKPFQFIGDLYEIRRGFAAKGNMASESLKLGLNSIYGKLVQQAGYRRGRIPTYHQLLWGGLITSYTRAKLFDAAMQNPKAVIAFATDAIFSTLPLDLPCSKDLGEWTPDEFNAITIIQAGVYFLRADDPQCKQNHDHVEDCYWKDKYRGFDKGSIDRELVIEAWKEGRDYEATTSRFVGLGSAIHASDFTIWRTWQNNKTRALDIRPTGKRIPGSNTSYATGLRSTKAAPNITPEILSSPYPLAWVEGFTLSDLDGNIRTLIDEEEDGFL